MKKNLYKLNSKFINPLVLEKKGFTKMLTFILIAVLSFWNMEVQAQSTPTFSMPSEVSISDGLAPQTFEPTINNPNFGTSSCIPVGGVVSMCYTYIPPGSSIPTTCKISNVHISQVAALEATVQYSCGPCAGSPSCDPVATPTTFVDWSITDDVMNATATIDILTGKVTITPTGGTVSGSFIMCLEDSPGGANSCVTVNIDSPAAAPPIPTMSEWGMLVFVLLILNLGLMLVFVKEQFLARQN